MRSIRLLIEYEGTRYAGWQAQAGQLTIQGSLIEAARHITQDDVAIPGASRTDAGVHAFGQVACLKTAAKTPLHKIQFGMNSVLPPDIVVKEVEEMGPEYDPRRQSKGKIYIYKILNRSYPSGLLRNFAWHVFKPLDINAMKEAALHLIGEKDFSSFKMTESDDLHSIREVTSVEIYEKGEGVIEIEVRGTAFLRHMVRILAGTLVAVGNGKLRPDDMPRIIEARDRTAAAMTAPPHGLILMKVEY